MTMRLWCRPGVSFELGQLKLLVAPPDRLAALLDLPEIGSFHTLYLYAGLSEVLFRVPPIRSEHFETEVCTTLEDAIAAVSRSYHTVLMVEWSPAIVAGLDAEERGQRMSRLAKALKRRATNGIVIVYAPAMDKALQLVADEADQTVWLVPEPAPARATVAVTARAKAQRTLF